MAWSTRELAELTGTTVNTIRHYHRLGLLPEPERRYNGYKKYGIQDLVRLLRIRRLTDLGVPLARIGADGGPDPEVLRKADEHLAADIERLVKARSDIAAILRDGAPADTPAGFESVASRLSAADSSLIHIYRQLYDEKAMTDLRRMVETADDPVNQEFDTLPADADETTRRDIAERLAPVLVRHLVEYPWLNDPGPHLYKSEQETRQTFLDAVAGLYNAAQLDVVGRAAVLAQEHLRREQT
ncbi:helix-turn-helix domain-containing protein [Paractinoplanes lichenicola]|uniref:MerR family DNA-binding transcriptional regulator n=1 Tax=Paractinoplanes lichenicola TaxID=2802976 RepID=A0ABS1VFM4_9ACTN|nr:MerR family transcriptional regulator [Actinoplanes lichenicola]MBL7253507.1 MerR family DNA-binding transcriptional regulator [Actinoplanes lichenicola]